MGSRSFSHEETEGKVGLTFDDLGRLKSTERDAQNENEIQDMLSPNCKGVEPSPISVLESSQEDMTSPTKFSWSEGNVSVSGFINFFFFFCCLLVNQHRFLTRALLRSYPSYCLIDIPSSGIMRQTEL